MCPVVARLLAEVSLDGPIRLANWGGLSDKSSICLTLVSRFFSHFETPKDLEPELLNNSRSETEYGLLESMFLKGFLSIAVQH